MLFRSAYKVVGGVAIVSGDPIGPPARYAELLERFIEFAHARDWRIAVLGASERCLDLYRAYGLHALYHGDEAVAWARQHGFGRISLNFAPFAALLAPEAELSALQRVERQALLALKGHFQLDNLLLFNRKFGPSWERRFVVYERRRDLPRVGIAALAAEAYLPFAARERDAG